MRHLILGCFLFCASADAQTAPTTAVLPTAGEGGAAVDRLLEQLAGTGKLEGPAACRRRLQIVTTDAVAAARRDLARSREDELGMRRAAAVSGARRAIERLLLQRVHLVAPLELVQARLALAQALLLNPADRAQAQATLAQLHRQAPGWAPRPRTLHPRLLAIWRTVERGAEPAAPAPADLHWIAARLGATQVVWLGRGGDRLRMAIFTAATSTQQIQSFPLVQDARQLRQQLCQMLAPGGICPAANKVPPGGSARTTPWYRKWWPWVTAGAVVVAASVAVSLAITLPSEQNDDKVDLLFRF